jgi:hypothetical protein
MALSVTIAVMVGVTLLGTAVVVAVSLKRSRIEQHLQPEAAELPFWTQVSIRGIGIPLIIIIAWLSVPRSIASGLTLGDHVILFGVGGLFAVVMLGFAGVTVLASRRLKKGGRASNGLSDFPNEAGICYFITTAVALGALMRTLARILA